MAVVATSPRSRDNQAQALLHLQGRAGFLAQKAQTLSALPVIIKTKSSLVRWAIAGLLLVTMAGLVACGGSSADPKTAGSEESPSGSGSSVCSSLDQCVEHCENHNAEACEAAGRMYETGEGAPQDLQRAAGFYDKACEEGRDQACAHLAMMYDIGFAVEEDPERANELYRRACASGNRWACRRGQEIQK